MPQRSQNSISKALARMAGAFVLLTGSAATLADSMNEPFLTSEVKSFTGAPHSFTTLSNEDLALRADQMRVDALTPSQRAMNYQWLSEHSDNEKHIHGEKAITKLIERHLKSYIDERAGGEWIKSKLMPDSGGNGFIKNVDYDVKLNANKLVIGVTYEF